MVKNTLKTVKNGQKYHKMAKLLIKIAGCPGSDGNGLLWHFGSRNVLSGAFFISKFGVFTMKFGIFEGFY
jgi:hypothetical protein